GSYVIMPPLYNPVYLAEEAAMIDLLSRGRLILGLGVGYHPRYFDHFGVPVRQREGRFEESLEVMRKAWTIPGPSAHHGKYYHYDAIHLTPKPYQRPHPLIWIGAFGPKSIARAGRLGDVWAMSALFHTLDVPNDPAGVYPTAGGGGAPPAQGSLVVHLDFRARPLSLVTRHLQPQRRDDPWISNTPPNRKPSVLKCEAGWRRIYRLTCAWTTPGMSALPRTTRPSSDDGHGKKPCIPLAGWASPGPSSMGEAGPVSSSR